MKYFWIIWGILSLLPLWVISIGVRCEIKYTAGCPDTPGGGYGLAFGVLLIWGGITLIILFVSWLNRKFFNQKK